MAEDRSRKTMAQWTSEERVLRAAMAWYRQWVRESSHPPLASNGQTSSEIKLYAACKRYARDAAAEADRG